MPVNKVLAALLISVINPLQVNSIRYTEENLMPSCRCTSCEKLFDAKSSQFGSQVQCPTCGKKLSVDIDLLARFSLPDSIHVRLIGEHREITNQAIKVEYCYPLGPFNTDKHGILILTKPMIEEAIANYISIDGIMDHKYDEISCHRYINLFVGVSSKTVDLETQDKEIKLEITV